MAGPNFFFFFALAGPAFIYIISKFLFLIRSNYNSVNTQVKETVLQIRDNNSD